MVHTSVAAECAGGTGATLPAARSASSVTTPTPGTEACGAAAALRRWPPKTTTSLTVGHDGSVASIVLSTLAWHATAVSSAWLQMNCTASGPAAAAPQRRGGARIVRQQRRNAPRVSYNGTDTHAWRAMAASVSSHSAQLTE